MPRTPYEPTVTDALTGQNIRALRQRRGETLRQTVERSGFGKDASTLAATERGERLLTDVEATKLAAHFDTTVDTIRAKPSDPQPPFVIEPATEQDWLGNTPKPDAPALFAVPDAPHAEPTPEGLQRLADDVFKPADTIPLPGARPDLFLIDLREPLTPDQYREQVWYPYLEARYTADTA